MPTKKTFKLPRGIYPEAQDHTGPTKPPTPPKKTRRSKKLGITLLLLIIAGASYWIFNISHDSGIKLQPPATAYISNAKEKNCEKDVGDKNFCQFAARFDPLHTPFTETSAAHISNGLSTSTILQSDGNNNASLVQSRKGNVVLEATSLNGSFYLKDDNDPFWTKYNTGSVETYSDNVNAPKSAVQAVSQIIDTSDVTGNHQISYKLVGKEYCGKLTCLKYQIIVQHLVSSAHYIWFDSKYFLLRHEYTHSSSSWTDNQFDYGPVNISAPGPIKP